MLNFLKFRFMQIIATQILPFELPLIVSGLVGLILVVLGLTYQGLLPLLAYYVSIAVIGIFFFVFLMKAFEDYHNDLDQIQDFLRQVERNESLPTLREMRGIKRKGKR